MVLKMVSSTATQMGIADALNLSLDGLELNIGGLGTLYGEHPTPLFKDGKQVRNVKRADTARYHDEPYSAFVTVPKSQSQ